MFTHQDVLTPLALTVIIDHKVRNPEMTEFCRQAAGLIELFDLSPMSEANLLAWYEKNHDELTEKLSGKRRNTMILRALTRFKEQVHIENIYDAMLAISISDKEYVKEESELIRSAASIWGFSRPPFKVTR
ncbi:TerB family tellurite resistance protein [Hellea sp.]|nr:TerB family tellurite resistance protein [Hellea sp.]